LCFYCESAISANGIVLSYLIIYHGVLSNGKTFVAGFVLMESKSEKNYRETFSNLKSILNSQSLLLNPDFEKALQNALLKEFPNTKLSGCWFHFTQAGFDPARFIHK
jgi:transposase-like protein